MKRTLRSATACVLALSMSPPTLAASSVTHGSAKHIVMREVPDCAAFDRDCAGRIKEFINSYTQLAIACIKTPSMRPICQSHFSTIEAQLLDLRGDDGSSNPLENGKVLDATRFISQLTREAPHQLQP